MSQEMKEQWKEGRRICALKNKNINEKRLKYENENKKETERKQETQSF